MARWGMVIDLTRCIGCYGCQIACKAENGTPKGILWSRVEVQEVGKMALTRRIALPVLCMHCEEPECERVCPTGATQKRSDGIVSINAADCIGCKSCMMACPYGARYFLDRIEPYFPNGMTPYETRMYANHQVGTVVKCHFCKHRIDAALSRGLIPGVDREGTPACVINCMTKARFFGDVDDPESEIAQLISSGQAFQLRAELGTGPQVYYLPPGRAPLARSG